MTLGTLIERLQELADAHGEEVEVRLAHQPHWPLAYTIEEVIFEGESLAEKDEDIEEEVEEVAVYIGEGRQIGYLSGAASRALGWGRGR